MTAQENYRLMMDLLDESLRPQRNAAPKGDMMTIKEHYDLIMRLIDESLTGDAAQNLKDAVNDFDSAWALRNETEILNAVEEIKEELDPYGFSGL